MLQAAGGLLDLLPRCVAGAWAAVSLVTVRGPTGQLIRCHRVCLRVSLPDWALEMGRT